MIHLVIREPIAYQRTLCQALSDSFKGAFVVWFAEKPSEISLNPGETFTRRFLPDAGYSTLLRELRADPQAMLILGGWSSAMAFKTLFISTVLRIPVCIWADHPHSRNRNWAATAFRKTYLRMLGHRVLAFLTCGQPTAEHLASWGIDPGKIKNFPYWVAVPEEWSLPGRCRGNGDERPLQLVSVGRHVPVKAFEVAIEAIARANKDAGRTIATLELIGDGTERENLEEMARSLGLQNVVTFSGWLDNQEVWRRMREADALIVPSRFEPYGVVVLEAMANGRPVLASDRVIAAVDRNDGSGAIFLHPVGDAECLARQIKILCDDENILRRSSEAARAIAEKWRPERAASILKPILDQANPQMAGESNQVVRVTTP